ncbi:hypothetical protein [Streptomyces violaceusniger]|uniref:Uncharacterized protein n=1 Tax=Streptomyces violaceusniger (strain Tu 4113) TaxID=653045 RepID=G2PHL9_STRV4|nr:hypothetical protein [Streptomyces violaceusniger]AEM89022.1 hypothetical protein Strvi_0249 [Streptomyces violaceusniger Tu 4113]
MGSRPQAEPETKQEECPRCEGPLRGFPEDIGASSRVTTPERDVRICGQCGTDEAVRDAAGFGPVPLDEWPVRRLLTWTAAAA